MATIGDRLRYLIAERGMEQKQFAELFGLKVSTLNGYVTNYRTPDIGMQKRFADFFGVTVDYLIGRTEERLVSEKKFRGSNILLIKGSMTFDQLSMDISKKLNLQSSYDDLFTANYLENLAMEKTSPTPQRITLLSSYADVNSDFFYVVNNSESLRVERELYKKIQKNTFVYHLSNEMYDFILDPQNERYIKLAADIKNKGIDPDDIVSFSLRYK